MIYIYIYEMEQSIGKKTGASSSKIKQELKNLIILLFSLSRVKLGPLRILITHIRHIKNNQILYTENTQQPNPVFHLDRKFAPKPVPSAFTDTIDIIYTVYTLQVLEYSDILNPSLPYIKTRLY
jgi:hypothetical protein